MPALSFQLNSAVRRTWFSSWFSMILITALIGATLPATASSLRISAGASRRLANEVEADYATSHFYINEVAGNTVPITIFFDPQTTGVQSAEVYTNLNRRSLATVRIGTGEEEGINPPPGNSITAGDDRHYYKAFPMTLVQGGYQITLTANKCGAYRLTARYRLNGDAPGTYRWYGTELNGQGIPKRDYAIVISPNITGNIRMYEANVLTILATGTGASQRGTLADLAGGLGPGSVPAFSLKYMKDLGANMLWLQPIHPRGIDGRQTDPTTNRPFEIGSPYAVKNFFEVMPLMAKSFTPSASPQGDDTPAGRAQAMTEFQQFVRQADAQGIAVMLDAPFNHTAHDVELASRGQKYWANSASPMTEIRSVEARFFSRQNAYDMRASGVPAVADAPDRSDFGKWKDVFDIFFGRYAALVPNPSQQQNYLDEHDWFDYSVGSEQGEGNGNGHFDAITANVWRYFGDYLQFWLTQTGYPANSALATLDSTAGIDGLRADFAQGLPPQCWEYLVNRTRARKWNFVFMAESLDGGAVTYRSSRHFDLLNENLIYDLYSAASTADFRSRYDQRRNSYNGGLTLLNTSSQDEDNYKNPFEALLRFATNSTQPGATMIFPGQELGLSGTVIPPNRSVPSAGPPFGYDKFEINFGKPIPSFMVFNSMMPLWQQLRNGQGNAKQIHDVYAAINQARGSSPALRGPVLTNLNLLNNTQHQQIFSVAKVEKRNANPNGSDVVFAFVNLTLTADQETSQGNLFNLNVDEDRDGTNDFGIQPNALYNVRNIAAYGGVDPHRRDQLLWPTARKGSDLLANGLFVHLNRVPTNAAGWMTAPWEPQYLKLVQVTK
jgi:glycosidase